VRWIADSYLRIDARSLGLFRILMGLTLVTDLLHRWDWLTAFYSNKGVLPNHNHLFLLKGDGHAWSLYHSFSSIDENHFAFVLTFIVYVAFTVGFKTRVFHLVTIICVIGLMGRNVLLDSVGASVAISLLAITALLPLGARFSVDSMCRSFAAHDEKTPDDLNARSHATPLEQPASLAALGVLLILALIYLGAALQQTGESWKDGHALYYALHVDRWTSALGVAVREQTELLTAWTMVIWYAQLAIVPLALVPVARKPIRWIVVALMLAHGLTFGLLFTFGLYGWSLVAAAALLLPTQAWETKPSRPVDLYYDADCGFCLWWARLFARLDQRGNITFYANGDELPEGITAKMADESMVVVGPDGTATVGTEALSQLLRSLPSLMWAGWIVLLPGLSRLTELVYRKVAENRLDISVAFGMSRCALPTADAVVADDDTLAPKTYRKPNSQLVASTNGADGDDRGPSPAHRAWSLTKVVLSSAVALTIVLAAATQTARNNELPLAAAGSSEWLSDIASWARVSAKWGVFAPEPPRDNGSLVVDAHTRTERRVDLLTGHEPDLQLNNPLRARKGWLWEAYGRRIADDAYAPFRSEFRQYLLRGGHALDPSRPDNSIKSLNVSWISTPIPAPGEQRSSTVHRRELFSKRGGLSKSTNKRPGAKADALRKHRSKPR